MIDLRLLRTQPERVRTAMARRGSAELLAQLDETLHLDERAREIVARRDAIRARVNDLSKQVGQLRKAGDANAAESLQAESRILGDEEKGLAAEYDDVQGAVRDLLLRIPNVPHDEAPDGTSDHDNPVVKGPFGLLDDYPAHQRVPHWETATALGVLDNERATKISGAMFTMQRGLGATLSRALCQYALDTNADAFEEIRPPSLVTTATLTATGQLPKFADDAYAIERDDLWCIPTAEVPLTSLYGGEVLDEAQLPIRMMAYTPCYRREAGSAGRDTRGMLRAHEFDKVEILAVTTPAQGAEMLIELRDRAERLISGLELPYRIIEICTGDMGQSHHRSFDLEVYAPGCDNWLEVSSVSWFSDYQARRADIRYRTAGEKGTQIANTLNGSALAVPRVWAAIMENHRQPDGSVSIPTALRPYMRGATSIPAAS
ncbi:MAG: serine--tRNA ligase [Acidimicrobiales bacterium]|nr:serine--tRNA ligase [Acidimicrobiales bacterium]MCB9393662.1 serine--tRNA ligase [Acidimicrobiaceae bacterium]